MNRPGELVKHPVISVEENKVLFIGLVASAAGNLLLLFLLLGAICLICKRRSNARKSIKKDGNPLYGKDYEKDENKEDYDYMG